MSIIIIIIKIPYKHISEHFVWLYWGLITIIKNGIIEFTPDKDYPLQFLIMFTIDFIYSIIYYYIQLRILYADHKREPTSQINSCFKNRSRV